MKYIVLAASLFFACTLEASAQYMTSSDARDLKNNLKDWYKDNRMSEDEGKEIIRNEACWNEYFEYLEANSIVPDNMMQGGRDYCRGREVDGEVVEVQEVDTACWNQYLHALAQMSPSFEGVYDDIMMDCGESASCWEDAMTNNSNICGVDVYENALLFCQGHQEEALDGLSLAGVDPSCGGANTLNADCWENYVRELSYRDSRFSPISTFLGNTCQSDSSCWEDAVVNSSMMCGDVRSSAEEFCLGSRSAAFDDIRFKDPAASCSVFGNIGGGGGGGNNRGVNLPYYLRH